MNEKILNVRIPQNEFDLLTRYAAQTGRSKSEVVREFLRSLEKRFASKTTTAMLKDAKANNRQARP